MNVRKIQISSISFDMETNIMTKTLYSAPAVVKIGSFETNTLASSSTPSTLDAVFPSGTPFNQLTFS